MWTRRALNRPFRWFSARAVKTVGRNANLLLNISPNTDGTIDAVDMLAYRQLGAWVAQSFGRQVRGPA